MTKLKDLVDFLIPNYIKEGKSQLVIGVGCTGGRHRSVAISEALFSYLCGREHRVFIDHRDIDKDGRSKSKMKNDNWFRKKIAGYRWCLLIVFGIILISAGMLLAYRHDNTFDIFCSVLLFCVRMYIYCCFDTAYCN